VRLVLKGLLVWMAWMVMSVPVVLVVARVLKVHLGQPDPPVPRVHRERTVERDRPDHQGPRVCPDRPEWQAREGPRVFPARRDHRGR
jgi:hypothetical protein